MSKDPAFLFYPNDFTTGTQFFSDQQAGVYMRILCAQHQHGHLTKSQMRKLCDGIADKESKEEIFAKFTIDDDGKFFNERLDNEMLKRRAHAEKQRQNAMMRWHKSGIDLAMPLENENENVIENKNRSSKKKKTVSKFIPPTQQEVEAFVQGEGFPRELAVRVFKYYADANWHDSKGAPVKNWKQKIRGVWLKEENKKPNGKQGNTKAAGAINDHDLATALAKRHGFSADQ